MTKNLASHYPRQLKTLSKVAEAQAKAVDKKTGKPVGEIPGFPEIIKFMADHLPANKVSVVHGDYKIDNLIYHPTKPEVIAILDWELCTIGHPLADLGNLLQPYLIPSNDKREGASGMIQGFRGKDPWFPGLPTMEENLDYYTSLAGWDPSKDWAFAAVYSHFRVSIEAV